MIAARDMAAEQVGRKALIQRSYLLPILIGASLLTPIASVSAGDPGNGKILSWRCVACHGPAGVTENPYIPMLAGQNGIYLLRQLQNFKEGTRLNELMMPVAEALSAQEMDDVATYYASLGQQWQRAAQMKPEHPSAEQ